MPGRLLFVFLLFTVFVQPVFAQSSTQLNARICVLELDTNLPLAEASVEGNAEGGDLATGVTGSDGCVSLLIADRTTTHLQKKDNDNKTISNSFVHEFLFNRL